MDPRASDQKIVCPQCGSQFPLTEALAHRIEDEIRARYEERAQSEALRMREQIQKSVRDELSLELNDLSLANTTMRERLRSSEQRELELRREKRDLDEKRQALELEVARRLDDERERIRQEVRQQTEESSALLLREREKRIDDMLRQIEELKRRAEQGSQQAQGEVLELELERVLVERFPIDHIEPVAKGRRGADVLQRVVNSMGQQCGTIIWESKRTKAWASDWIQKLKEDQRSEKAEIAAIVSVVLPKEIRHFGQQEGVWLCDFPTVIGVATSLRAGLIETFSARQAATGRADKMELLYAFLSGPEFRQRIDGLVQTFREMKKELDQEQIAVTKMWAKREKQIQQFVEHTARMYGAMQGIFGAGMPEIPGLRLPGAEQLPLLASGAKGEPA